MPIVVSSTVLSSGDSVEVRRDVPDVDSYVAERTLTYEEGMERRRQFAQRQLAAFGGQDVMPLPDWPHPGRQELRDSLKTVDRTWRELKESDLRLYVVTGKPPSTVSAEKLAEYLAASAIFSTPIPSLVPALWLADEMERMHITPAFRTQREFVHGQMALGRTPEDMWFQMVAISNGFVKTVLELVRHYNPKKRARRSSA